MLLHCGALIFSCPSDDWLTDIIMPLMIAYKAQSRTSSSVQRWRYWCCCCLTMMTLKRSCRPHSAQCYYIPLSLLFYIHTIPHYVFPSSNIWSCCHPRLLLRGRVLSRIICRSADRGKERRAAAANSRWMGFCSADWSGLSLCWCWCCLSYNKTYLPFVVSRSCFHNINLIIIIMRPATLYDRALDRQSLEFIKMLWIYISIRTTYLQSQSNPTNELPASQPAR